MDIWVGLFPTGVNVCMVVPMAWFDSRGSVILDVRVWCWGAESRGWKIKHHLQSSSCILQFYLSGDCLNFWLIFSELLQNQVFPRSRWIFVVRLVYDLSGFHVLWASVNCCIPFRLNSWIFGFAFSCESLDVRIPCCLTAELSEFFSVASNSFCSEHLNFRLFRFSGKRWTFDFHAVVPGISDSIFARIVWISNCVTLNSWSLFFSRNIGLSNFVLSDMFMVCPLIIHGCCRLLNHVCLIFLSFSLHRI